MAKANGGYANGPPLPPPPIGFYERGDSFGGHSSFGDVSLEDEELGDLPPPPAPLLSSSSSSLPCSVSRPAAPVPGRPRRRALHAGLASAAAAPGRKRKLKRRRGWATSRPVRVARRWGRAVAGGLPLVGGVVRVGQTVFATVRGEGSRRRHGGAMLPLAIALWYLLGVLSIGTSKLLLMDSTEGQRLSGAWSRDRALPLDRTDSIVYVGGLRPLMLTVQQLGIGVTVLRVLLKSRAFGSIGIQGMPRNNSAAGFVGEGGNTPSTNLFLAGLFFGLGFLATNYSFQASSAALVETVKAAEPISSAGIAALWGIETLSVAEVASLSAIVAGVMLSTLANVGANGTMHGDSAAMAVKSCLIVMVANLCFSFRGLHQKLFRALPQGSASVIDDMNLQYRMQQIGILAFAVPAVIFELPGVIWELTARKFNWSIAWRYILLSLLNGFAFTSYNLSSTYILTRISVVHHASLNCIRRVFAIIVTSIAFGVPITALSTVGIALSVGGFFSFTHYKLKRLRQPRPLSSLLPMSVQ